MIRWICMHTCTWYFDHTIDGHAVETCGWWPFQSRERTRNAHAVKVRRMMEKKP